MGEGSVRRSILVLIDRVISYLSLCITYLDNKDVIFLLLQRIKFVSITQIENTFTQSS